MVQNPVGEPLLNNFTHLQCYFRQMQLLELTFTGFNFSRFLAVVNFANINSNEKFCPVGYICALIFSTCILCL